MKRGRINLYSLALISVRVQSLFFIFHPSFLIYERTSKKQVAGILSKTETDVPSECKIKKFPFKRYSEYAIPLLQGGWHKSYHLMKNHLRNCEIEDHKNYIIRRL